ncbi:MAG: caspase family protein [Acidobacteria bacterium]|nr:caspase family protein [Acidobacteriota bacterium]
MDENYAITAGINNYPGISSLRGPENDATWFHEWLVSNKLVNPDKNASLILGSQFTGTAESIDSQPDIMVINRAFERLLRIGRSKSRIGKRLYLFFAGHGFGPDLNTSALLASNADLLLGTTGHHLNAVEYADWFAAAAYFDEIVLFMDCCRDDMPRAPLGQAPCQSVHNVRGGQVKRFYGLATRWAKKAREAEAANGDVHGYFTQALMGALDGGAVTADGRLNTADVTRYVLNYFTQRVKPKLDAIGAGFDEPQFLPKDEFAMAEGLATKLTAVTVQFQAPAAAASNGYSIFGGSPNLLRPNTGGANPWRLELPMGHYALMNPDGQSASEFDAFGEAVDLHV